MYKSRRRKNPRLSSVNPLLPSPLSLFPSATSLLSAIGVIYQSEQDSGHSLLLHTLSHTTSQLQELAACACNLFTNLQQRAFLNTAVEQRLRTIAQSDFLVRMQ